MKSKVVSNIATIFPVILSIIRQIIYVDSAGKSKGKIELYYIALKKEESTNEI